MSYQHQEHIDKFEVVALGNKYLVYAYDGGNYIFYRAHGPVFEEILLLPIERDNPPCFAIDGKTVNELSQALTAAIESYNL